MSPLKKPEIARKGAMDSPFICCSLRLCVPPSCSEVIHSVAETGAPVVSANARLFSTKRPPFGAILDPSDVRCLMYRVHRERRRLRLRLLCAGCVRLRQPFPNCVERGLGAVGQVRLARCSWPRIRLTCVRTVGSLTAIRSAISWLLSPCAISRSTVISRSVSTSGVGCSSAGRAISCNSLRAIVGWSVGSGSSAIQLGVQCTPSRESKLFCGATSARRGAPGEWPAQVRPARSL
jgi:hypothetical protein